MSHGDFDIPTLRFNRFVALAVLLPCVVLLGIAASLRAADGGVGTHQQLGLPACSFLGASGLPCATCGMTTAFSYAADGKLFQAVIVQPAGATFAVAAAAMVIVSIYALITGMSLAPLGKWLVATRMVIWFCAFVVAAWGYKTLVMTGWLW